MVGLGRTKEKLVQINQSAIKGEKGTGYEDPAGKGEFECENCSYYRAKDSSCGQKDMMEKSKRLKTPEGRVKVDAEGCCEYVERVGREDKDEEN